MLSADTSQLLTDFLEKEGREWVNQYLAERIAFLKKRKIEASGQLIASLEAEVSSALENAVRTSIAIQFEEHGRFIDMKKLQPPQGGGNYIAAIEEWIGRKGFAQKFTQKFMAGRKLKVVPKNVLNQIAWGIVKSRSDKYRRRKGWYTRSRAGAVNDLYNRVAAGIPEIVLDEIRRAFPVKN